MTAYKDHATIEQVFPDTMPKEAAIELLCAPLGRLDAATRRACHAARANYFQSKQQRKAPEEKLVSKVRAATIAQVYKWLKRAKERRMDCQRAFLRVTGTTPLHDRLRAALEVKAAECDIMRDVCETELQDRTENQREIQKRKQDAKRI